MDLDIRRVIRSIPKNHGPEELAPLVTRLGEQLGHDEVYRGHPRPKMQRKTWESLDGWWECCFVKEPHAATAWRSVTPPKAFGTPIRVPFSPEARLSGVGRQLQPHELLWYRRRFASPALAPGARCVLTFDGVDYACAVYVNGRNVAEHEGAYLPFSTDITDALLPAGEGDNELAVCVYDPSDTGTQLRGKQRLKRGGMWYTAQSGIWKPVWLEVRPRTHVSELLVDPNPTTGEVTVSVRATGVALLEVEVLCGERLHAQQSRRINGLSTVVLTVPDHQLWEPDHPQLYDMVVHYGDDTITSYFAFRTVGIEADEQGVPRFCLNHRPLFVRGILDQGYWPESLMTPPTYRSLGEDLRAVKRAGFNLVRKHVKVEAETYYALCDALGLLVLQDMPSGGAVPSERWSRDLPTLRRKSWHTQADDTPKSCRRLGSADDAYRSEWTRTCQDMVRRLSRYSCVMGWVLFNESWGQFDSAAATQMVRELDPTRPVVAASGWYDQGAGDIRGVHNYFRGMHLFDDPYAPEGGRPARAQMITEFGGLTWHVDAHSQLAHAYGYAEFETVEQWRQGLRELLDHASALEAQGLSGFVYTQLSDVEEETNGLLTYDRRVNKLADEDAGTSV